MEIFSLSLVVVGLSLFEIISSIDNAVVNAEVLNTMSERARKWFLLWGLLFAVFIVRGMLPWMIVWAANPSLGFLGSFTAAWSSDPSVIDSIEQSAPILLVGGGIFLVFLFFHWLFMEEKEYGLVGERFFHSQGIWFYAVISIILSVVVWFSLKINPNMALGAVVGSTAFFITHGFKQNAEEGEKKLIEGSSNKSDLSKILYLEVIDTTFSIDGVLGAFAFTMSVPLIILGSGLGAVVLRKLTVSNMKNVQKYIYLKNGAMYSIFFLGAIMVLHSFGAHIPEWLSPIITISIVLFFFLKSKRHIRMQAA